MKKNLTLLFMLFSLATLAQVPHAYRITCLTTQVAVNDTTMHTTVYYNKSSLLVNRTATTLLLQLSPTNTVAQWTTATIGVLPAPTLDSGLNLINGCINQNTNSCAIIGPTGPTGSTGPTGGTGPTGAAGVADPDTLYITSGRYLPDTTATINISNLVKIFAPYTQIDSVVNVDGEFDAHVLITGQQGQINFTLPIPASLYPALILHGEITTINGRLAGAVLQGAGNTAQLQFFAADTGNYLYKYHYTYITRSYVPGKIVQGGIVGATGPTGATGPSGSTTLYTGDGPIPAHTMRTVTLQGRSTLQFVQSMIDGTDTAFFLIRMSDTLQTTETGDIFRGVSIGDTTGHNALTIARFYADSAHTVIVDVAKLGSTNNAYSLSILNSTTPGASSFTVGTPSGEYKFDSNGVLLSDAYTLARQGGNDGDVLTYRSGGRVALESPDSRFWSTTGNSNLDPTVNYIGLNDHDSLRFVAAGADMGMLAAVSKVIAFGNGTVTNNIGQYIVAVGPAALQNNTSDFVVAIGNAVAANNSGSNVVSIGNSAGASNTGSNAVIIGHGSGLSNTTEAVIIGTDAGTSNLGIRSVMIGNSAGAGNTGSKLVACGYSTGYGNNGTNVTAIGNLAAVGNIGNNSEMIGFFPTIVSNQFKEITCLGTDAHANRDSQMVFSDNRVSLKMPLNNGATGSVLVYNPTDSTASWQKQAVAPSGSTGSEPGTPIVGQFYFDTTLTKMKFWNGAVWAVITSTP